MAIDNKQLARRLIEEVWNKGNLQLIDELVDPNYDGRDPLVGATKRDGLRESVKAYRAAFPDLKIEVASILSEGNFVCTRWTAKGTHRGTLLGMAPTGKTAVVTGIDFAEIRNGKILVDYAEYDALGLLRQLGLDSVAMPLPSLKPAVESAKHA